MNEIVCSVCLIPSKDDQKYLEKIILSLVNRYKTPIFLPHLTVYGMLRASQSEIEDAVDYALTDITQFSVKVDKLSYSDAFTKTLYIQFKINEILSGICNRLGSRLQRYLINRQEYELNPHISLVYKHGMSNGEKEDIINSINIKKEFSFDSCSIVSASRPIEIEEDIKSWKVVYTKIF